MDKPVTVSEDLLDNLEILLLEIIGQDINKVHSKDKSAYVKKLFILSKIIEERNTNIMTRWEKTSKPTVQLDTRMEHLIDIAISIQNQLINSCNSNWLRVEKMDKTTIVTTNCWPVLAAVLVNLKIPSTDIFYGAYVVTDELTGGQIVKEVHKYLCLKALLQNTFPIVLTW